MSRRKIVILFSLILLLSFNSVVIKAKDRYLGQKESFLKKSNGKIIKLNRNVIKLSNYNNDDRKKVKKILSKYSFYRMKYLSDGLEVVGYMVRPKKKGKYPVIIYNRGGNKEDGKIDKNLLSYFKYLSSKGYVVIGSQYRGNDGGEGKEEYGGADVNDVLNLIPLAKSLPFTRNDQIVMYGGSRGGMMTYLAIKRGGADIKAAAVLSGITNVKEYYNKGHYKVKRRLRELIGGSPTEMKQEYIKRSAYYWPEKIDVPVLILHGKFDQKVNVEQAKRLSEKLEKLNKDYKLLLYSDNYNISMPSNYEERNKKLFDWFAKYIINQ